MGLRRSNGRVVTEEEFYKAKAETARLKAQARANRQSVNRGAIDYDEYIYISQLNKDDLIKIKVNSKTIIVLGNNGYEKLGLYTLQEKTAAEGQQPTIFTPDDRKKTVPTFVSWYYGDITPANERTEWGTRWKRLYDKDAQGQSHRSAPFSVRVPEPTTKAVIQQFNALFAKSGDNPNAMIGPRGLASLRLESRILTVKG
jgi:hypothetical protein